MAARFEVYRDGKDEYRWRLKHSNGHTIATGGEGYASESSCRSGIASVKREAAEAEVVEV